MSNGPNLTSPLLSLFDFWFAQWEVKSIVKASGLSLLQKMSPNLDFYFVISVNDSRGNKDPFHSDATSSQQ